MIQSIFDTFFHLAFDAQILKTILNVFYSLCPYTGSNSFIIFFCTYTGAIFNRGFKANDQISYMGWVAEGVLNRNQPWQNWKPKFFALRGSEVCIFESPPIEAGDWNNRGGNLQSYPIHQAMFR